MDDARSDPLAAIVEAIRSHGGRVTTSRLVVIDALVRGPGHHVTAYDLTARIRLDHPEFHESTVYRTLDRLVELGVVTRIEGDGGAAVFHVATAAHHHVVCDRCGRVVGVEADLLRAVGEQLLDHHGFVLRADAVTLPGRCVRCAAPAAVPPGTGPALAHEHATGPH